MDSSGFSSPRLDIFPAGLRVLVVDDDPTWLKILEKMLKKCNYEVTICNLARDALDLLRERRDGFDIVISDVNMPDMDGFKLLEHVGLEMDLPVIMMSVDGETSRVMKGVQHGACDYLLKPIRMKELRNIWQHVFRKRVHEMRDVEGYESLEEIQMMRSGMELSDGDSVSRKKRKDAENKHIDGVCGDSSSVKKARVFWTVELHQKFVKAVNQIGFEKVGPKKILDLMGEPWLTRENVASHLQKYRLYLIRLQKENELKATIGGTKRSDNSSKDFSGDVCLQNSITKNPTTVQQNILIHNDEPKTETNVKWTTFSMSMADSEKGALLGDTNDLAKSNKTRIGYNHSFDLSDSDVQSEPKIQAQYSWSAGVPPLQFKQENKPRFHSENGFDHLPMSIHHIQIDPAQTSPARNATTQDKETDEPTQARFKPSYSKNTSQDINKLTKTESTAALFPVQSESHLTDWHTVDSIPSSTWNSENLSLEQNLFDVPKYSQRNLVLGTGSGIRLWDEGFANYSSQVDIYPPNAHLGSFDPLSYDNQDLVSDIPPYLYDILKFDPEFPSDTVEYPVMEQGCVHSMRLSMY